MNRPDRYESYILEPHETKLTYLKEVNRPHSGLWDWRCFGQGMNVSQNRNVQDPKGRPHAWKCVENVCIAFAKPSIRACVCSSGNRKLLESENVIFAGYKVTHPLFHELLLKVRTDGNVEPIDAAIDAIDQLVRQCDELEKRFAVCRWMLFAHPFGCDDSAWGKQSSANSTTRRRLLPVIDKGCFNAAYVFQRCQRHEISMGWEICPRKRCLFVSGAQTSPIERKCLDCSK